MARHIVTGLFAAGFGFFLVIGGLRNTWSFSRLGLGKYWLGQSPAWLPPFNF